MKRLILAAVCVGLGASAARGESGHGDSLEPPELPPPSYEGEMVGSEVTIIDTGQERIYEYRVRGQVYMVKIQPIAGPPYYLLDTTGDGRLDTRRDRVWENDIPQWTLFSW